jgi:predicted porin
MKKILITVAILGGASGAAMAQSSVTLYGAVDVGIGKATSTGDTKVGMQSNTLMGNRVPQIGVRGKEDLGGGTSASFDFEAPINMSTGQAGVGTSFWNRSAYVALSNPSFGTLEIGRNWTAAFDAHYSYELTQDALYSVLFNTFGFGAKSDPWNSAQFKYKTPAFGGFTAEVAYIFKGNGDLIDNGIANVTSHWEMNAIYNQGPITVAFDASQALHADAAATSVNPHYDKISYALGGQYRYQHLFAVTASYSRNNTAAADETIFTRANPSVNTQGRRYGFELGGSVFLGPYTVTLDLTRDTKTDLYGGQKYTNGLLEGKYALSKSTFLYAAYLRLDGDNNYVVGVSYSF